MQRKYKYQSTPEAAEFDSKGWRFKLTVGTSN
jgi:hypothetical protein